MESLIPGILLVALGAGGVFGWSWWRKHRTRQPRMVRDTTHLGPFVNLSLLSDKGGMAKIHRATNSETKRDCVLKVLRSEMLGNSEVVKKFRREADILQSIKQASPDAPVVTVFSTGTISTSFVELPYIEMEYIPGGTDLSDFIRNHQRIDPQVAAKIVAQIVQALRCAEGIAVHRDLKPGNIMLANGDPGRVIVCDFGVAKDLDSRSVSQSAYGTAAYMAPEQCIPDGRVTRATDVYALGVIWYRMLTGTLLFDDPNPLVVMRSHVEVDPRPLIEANVPEPFRDLLLRMLAKDPAERPGFDEMEHALQEPVRKFEGVPAPTDDSRAQTEILKRSGPSPFAGAASAPRRSPWEVRRVAGIGGAALCVLGIIWFAFHQMHPVTPAAPGKPVAPAALGASGTPGPSGVSAAPATPIAPVVPAPTSPPPAPPMGTAETPRSKVPPLRPPAGEAWEVTSAPSGAAVRVDGAIAGQTPLTVTMPAGDHTVRVTLEEHAPFESATRVQPGKGGKIHAALTPLTASLTVASSPAGAEIVFDGAVQGAAPVSVGGISAGRYLVKATLEGYPPQERWLILHGGQQTTTSFSFELERGFLSVRCDQAEADIFLDTTRLIGVTPVARLPLPVGTYTLTAHARGYRDFRTTVTIERGAERLVEIPLEAAAATESFLTVDVEPAGALVQVDGAKAGLTPLVGWKLVPGNHLLVVTSPGRRPLERRVLVAAGATASVTGTLGAGASTLEIVSDPPGFGVLFDGVLQQGTTPLTLADQPLGRHRVALVQGGRLRWQGEVTLDGAREREVVRAVVAAEETSPQPVGVNGSISVNVTVLGKPGWGAVAINGKVVGNSPVLIKDLEPQEYTIRVQRPGFQRAEMVVTLASGERKLVTVDIVPQ